MATVTGYTAERMKQIEDAAIVSGVVSGDDLILTRHNGESLNAGSVRGPQGPTGTTGGIADAPSNDGYYVRRNGTWVLERISNAPSDGHKYGLRNGAWVRIERPWELLYSNAGPTPPPGWSISNLTVGQPWSMAFSGSGNLVNFRFTGSIRSSVASEAVRVTFPTAIRPTIDVWANLVLSDTRAGYRAVGNGLARVEANGSLKMPVSADVPMARTLREGNAVSEVVLYPGDSANTTTYVWGSFIRDGSELPPNASYS